MALAIVETVVAQDTSQPWRLLDHGLNARATAVTAEADSSRIYAAGFAIDENGSHIGVVRASGDSGNSWNTLDTWRDEVWPHASYLAICWEKHATFTGGEVFTGGSAGSNRRWIVRESMDEGRTWFTSDIVDAGPEGEASCHDVEGSAWAVFGSGVVATNHGTNGWAWIVRKSRSLGEHWTTVDTIVDKEGADAAAIAVRTNGTVLVAGKLGNTWTVRRSQDGGESWRTVDTYRAGPGLGSAARAIAADPAGKIYVAGMARALVDGKYADQWVVRRSINNGATWSLVNNTTLNLAAGRSAPLSGANAITVAPSGTLFTAGFMVAADGSTRWLVQRGVPGTDRRIGWTTIQNYQASAGQPSQANAITTDANENALVLGGTKDNAGVEHWVTMGSPR